MKILLTTFILLFLVCCYPTTSKQVPRCLFESEICLGSTLEEIQNVFPDMISHSNEYYQYVTIEQQYSRDKSSKVTLFKATHLRFDDQNFLEKFKVNFIELDDSEMSIPNYWEEVLLAIGRDQLRHYRIKDLDWERPWQYEDSVLEPGGEKVVHSFNKSDIELVSIEVSSPQ